MSSLPLKSSKSSSRGLDTFSKSPPRQYIYLPHPTILQNFLPAEIHFPAKNFNRVCVATVVGSIEEWITSGVCRVCLEKLELAESR